jgi:hypothetical protein
MVRGGFLRLQEAFEEGFESGIEGSMIRKSGNRFSLAASTGRVCAEIMLKQRDDIMMRFHLIAS